MVSFVLFLTPTRNPLHGCSIRKMAMLFYMTLLIMFRRQAEAYNATESEPDPRENLIFGFFTLTATIVISVVAVIIISCTIMTCYIDFNRMKQGIGNLEVCDEPSEEQPISTKSTVQPLTGEESSRDSGRAVKPSELVTDVIQISKIGKVAPTRIDAEEKQARIIEAIYQASGREVPPMYRSKTRSREAIPLPPIEIHETVAGIAEKEVPEPGSPISLINPYEPRRTSAPRESLIPKGRPVDKAQKEEKPPAVKSSRTAMETAKTAAKSEKLRTDTTGASTRSERSKTTPFLKQNKDSKGKK
ncbi:hypothetical protein V3C99_016310 [Haemonchus contortus]